MVMRTTAAGEGPLRDRVESLQEAGTTRRRFSAATSGLQRRSWTRDIGSFGIGRRSPTATATPM
jgi:hypothetical protein